MFRTFIYPSISARRFSQFRIATTGPNTPVARFSYCVRYGWISFHDNPVKRHLQDGAPHRPALSSGLLNPFTLPIIGIIVSVGAPLQVLGAIIGFVLVLVVYAWIIIGVWDKCLCNNPMNHHGTGFPVFVKVNALVAGCAVSVFQDSLLIRPFPSERHYLSFATNQIAVLVAHYGLPDFLTLHTKSMFMFKANIMKIHEKSNRGVSQHSRLLKTIVLVCGTKIRTIFNLFIP